MSPARTATECVSLPNRDETGIFECANCRPPVSGSRGGKVHRVGADTKLWAAPVYTFRLNAAVAGPDIASSSSFGVFARAEGERLANSYPKALASRNNSICLLPRKWGRLPLVGVLSLRRAVFSSLRARANGDQARRNLKRGGGDFPVTFRGPGMKYS